MASRQPRLLGNESQRSEAGFKAQKRGLSVVES
jgi:hypothetical protein